jgi:hypothetical protein
MEKHASLTSNEAHVWACRHELVLHATKLLQLASVNLTDQESGKSALEFISSCPSLPRKIGRGAMGGGDDVVLGKVLGSPDRASVTSPSVSEVLKVSAPPCRGASCSVQRVYFALKVKLCAFGDHFAQWRAGHRGSGSWAGLWFWGGRRALFNAI